MSRAQLIALKIPKPQYDPTDELEAIRASIRGLGESIQELRAEMAQIKPDDSKIIAAVGKVKPASLEPVLKAVAALDARVNEIEERRANAKLQVTFDVLTDAAGDIRQIVARET